ncbi:hypothetical protein JCM8097_004276 [Rhodosporidiobolus ruineniae]
MAPNPYIKAIAPGATASPGGSKSKSKKGGKQHRASDVAGNGTGAAASPVKGKGKADETLKAEVLALGGDEEDLELLADVDSESEVEEGGEAAGGAGLLSDLKSFMKGLDFSAAGATAPASDDDEDDADDLEEIEEAPAPAPKKVEEAAPAEKESKHDREERRRIERVALKEAEDERRLEERIAKEEKRRAKAMPSTKSPWVVDPTPHWYAVPVPSPSASASKPSPSLVSALLSRGQTLLDKENQLYSSSLDPKASKNGPPPPTGLSKADQIFIQQVLTSGTSSDKISALLLLVSSSPLHNMTYLDQLAALCRKKSRDESGRAVRGVVDWFRGEGGGSPDRKLRYFADQPALATVAQAYEAHEKGGKLAREVELEKEDVDRCLVLFAFEDWFKKWFFQILQALEQMSVDPLAHPRNQAVMHLSNLLRDRPEQESNILRLLTNKLGDTQRAIASKTSHHLLQVLQTHPGMTPILVREVSALILHPRTSQPTSAPSAAAASGSHMRFGDDSDDDKKKKAATAAPPRDHARDNSRYYGVTTLNQVMLKKEQADVAGKMVDVYFEVFGDVLGRLPDKEDSDDEKEAKNEEPKKLAGKKRSRDEGKKGGKGGKKSKGAAAEDDQAVNDVDAKLVAAVLTGINRAFPFAKIDDEAFKRRLDTLFRLTHTGTFNVSIQALMLIFRVSSAKREFSDRFYRALYTSLHDPRLTHSSKQALYLNLIFRATKEDKDANRVAAFVKRLIQILFGMETTFVLGALFVVGELLATTPGLRDLLTVPESTKLAAVAEAAEAEKKKKGKTAAAAAAEEEKPAFSPAYDGRKREPRFANALNSCLWELTPLLHHYHPTVVSYASTLLSGQPLQAAEDLESFSLAHFLDRFVYREAKKSAASKGSSMMQSGLAGQDSAGRVVRTKGAGKTEEAVNSDKFRRQNVNNVPADQVFFHHYFTSLTSTSTSKSAAATRRKSRRGGKDSDDSDADSDAGSEASIGDLGEADKDHLGEEDERMAEAYERAETPEDDEFEVKELGAAEDEDETDEEREAEIWAAMKASMPREKGDSDVEDALEADDSEADGDEDDEDVAAFDYSDDEDDEVMKAIRAELAGAAAPAKQGKGKKAQEEQDGDSDLGVDEMDELVEFSGASDDEADLEIDEEDASLDVSGFRPADLSSSDDDAEEAEEDEDDADEPFVSAFPDEDALSDASDDGFLEADEDVFGSDEDVRLGGGESDDDEMDEADERQKRKEKKRKLKHLPTFASADDYAHLLGGSDDEEI